MSRPFGGGGSEGAVKDGRPTEWSRRGFLTRALRRLGPLNDGPSQSSPAAAEATTRTGSGPQEPLPSVISWLSDYMDGGGPAPSTATRRAPVALHRPPGAVAEALFLQRCTGCDDCRLACPHGSILKAPRRFRQAAGTPFIDPATAPCWLCDDLPCVTACEVQALTPDADPMGTAHISRYECLNSLGSECSTCVERCPVEGAIAFHRPAKAPIVCPALCAGCGICQYVCPAPGAAIGILPNARRSAPATGAADG